MEIVKDVFQIGVNDREIDLFEGQYEVPNGMAYNSYAVVDDKIAIMDSVGGEFAHEWLDNIAAVCGGRTPDYLVIQHMEPDHSANIARFMEAYPSATVVASVKAFAMMNNFYGTDYADRRITVGEGDTLALGRHTLSFYAAPMVHWPEVIVTYDSVARVLFSADAFGKFGATDADEDWACEARRYYFGIVGKYGAQVQTLLKKVSALDVQTICPLHGPVLTENLGYYLDLYNTWSSYGVETDGVVIAYTSVYGNTRRAVELLAEKLKAKGCPKVAVNDLARCDMAEAVEDAFRYGKIVLATTTYNGDIFPFMREFINHLTEHGIRNKKIALMENGTWAPQAVKVMRGMLEGCKVDISETTVKIASALSDDSRKQIEALASELCAEYTGRLEQDMNALHSIEYGLYVVTSNDGKKDNGCIVNSVVQLTGAPNRIAVTVNKDNYSFHVIKQTGEMNLNCLSTDAPFKVFEDFGFRSGRNVDKFEGVEVSRSENGLVYLNRYTNACISLKVEDYSDFGTHGMFVCSVTEARVLSDAPTMTYAYYHANVKPKPQTAQGKKCWVCKLCGYVYEGDELPDDFTCPLCKHPASDFELVE